MHKFTISLLFLATFMHNPFCAFAAECLEIDLHGQKITSANLESLLNSSLPTVSDYRGISLNLSENYLDDGDVSTLLRALEAKGLMDRLERLNLSNNRIGDKGILNLEPLLYKPNVQYVNIATNSADSETIGTLFALFKSRTPSGIDPLDFASNLATKLIWLPRYFSFRDISMPYIYKRAHQQYYGID